MTKVAIITRTKDRPLFLERSLQSVTNQSYDDYMHVVVNDGGDKDEVQRIVSKFGATDKVKVFHRDTSSGAPDTIFNESIDRVDSEFIAIHDDDDTWHPDFLKTTVAHLSSNEALGGVVVRADKIIEKVEGGQIHHIKTGRWMEDIKVINLYRQHIDNQLTPITFLFRRDAYMQVGKFDDTLPVVGDWEFGIRLLRQFDVDFIDPGYALANYHHRKHVEGTQGANSFAGNDLHRYYSNKVMNKYLRDELESGKLGSGYIMSQIKYDQSRLAVMFKKVLPSGIVNKIKQRIGN